MENDVKQLMEFIVHQRMKIKAELETLRFLEETDKKKSYKNEINSRLDRMKELDKMFEKLKKK